MIGHNFVWSVQDKRDDLLQRHQNGSTAVNLKKEKMIVDEGVFITAGGVSSYMDLSIYLTYRFGSLELASFVSKVLLIDPSRRLQTPYTAFDFNKAHGDGKILKLQPVFHPTLTENGSVCIN